MKATLPYRIASVLFVLFAAGHTFGFLNFKPPTAEGLAVRDAMNNVHYGANLSYGGFFVGFGLCVTVYMLVLQDRLQTGQTGRPPGQDPFGATTVREWSSRDSPAGVHKDSAAKRIDLSRRPC
jgi:hypothetical protein